MHIQPYADNPFYWTYKGQSILLLGGSIEDNLFQIPNLREHLDLLVSAGGNYLRCTLSSRDEGDVWPFERDSQSRLYDLEQPGRDYWSRVETFLDLTLERDIIVQFEVWDRFDYAREPWQDNPCNPKNNVNFGAAESGLPEIIETHPGRRENPFFRSIPALENNSLILRYQHIHVEKLLSMTLRYPNVLYCMDNETNESPAWPAYWCDFIRQRASEQGIEVHTTEMWDAWDLNNPQHSATFDDPDRYSFIDISQNNHNSGQAHWDGIQSVRARIQGSGRIRPMNTVKIYGANSGHFGTHRDAQERFWRNIFGGLAATRFHRPPSGLGLGETAQTHIRAMRLLMDEIDLVRCEPHNDLLHNRSENEAYCTASPATEYAVFFPDGGEVLLDVAAAADQGVGIRWLDVRACQWQPEESAETNTDAMIRLQTPREAGYWLALVRARG